MNKQHLRHKLNTLEKEIRKVKATLPPPNHPDYQQALQDNEALANLNHHLKRLHEEIQDALQHVKMARGIVDRSLF